jgi:hypothetical protein
VKNGALQYILLAAAGSLLLAGPVSAFDMGNMMNPSKWMGGNKDRDRYDDDYRGPGYGYGGPGYGYGGPGYGYGAPGYSQPGTESTDAEVKRLKDRLRQLEGDVR